MPLVLADRVRETTTTTGTGTITLAGAVAGFQSFAVIGTGNTTYYTINGGAEWEVGIGTYTSSGTTLSRNTVLASSNAGALVNFSAGIKDVFVTYPAGKSISNGYGRLPVANGGTGATSLTSGYLLKGNGTSAVSASVVYESGGNVGVGTSSPSAKLDVNGKIAASTAVETRGAFAYFQSYNTGAGTNLKYWRWWGNTSGALVFETVNDAYTSTTERMRVASGGEVLINATAATSFFDGKLNVDGRTHLKDTLTPLYAWNPSTTGDNAFVVFLTETAGTARGSIYYSRVSGQVVYAATSDYRTKDILGPVENTGAIIDALKVHTGRMHGGSIAYPMLVAHEAQEVIPFAVSGEKDAVNKDGSPKYQQMDHAILVPMLIAEIQSLRARVAALEAA